ncbi:MAG: hypothetical protein Q9213_002089 [Squamulea squamosa]
MAHSPLDYVDCTEIALALIDIEVEHFQLQNGRIDSDGDFGSAALDNPSHHVLDLLGGLGWRIIFQWRVFRTFLHLCRYGTCTAASLKEVVSYNPTSAKFRSIRSALSCFPIFDHLEATGRQVAHISSPDVDWRPFQAPLEWLTFMIVRSPFDGLCSINEIARRGLLGRFDHDRRDLHLLHPLIKRDVLEPAEHVAERQPVAPCLGLILPAGGNNDKDKIDDAYIQQQFKHRFARIARVCTLCLPVLRQAPRLQTILTENLPADPKEDSP